MEDMYQARLTAKFTAIVGVVWQVVHCSAYPCLPGTFTSAYHCLLGTLTARFTEITAALLCVVAYWFAAGSNISCSLLFTARPFFAVDTNGITRSVCIFHAFTTCSSLNMFSSSVQFIRDFCIGRSRKGHNVLVRITRKTCGEAVKQ